MAPLAHQRLPLLRPAEAAGVAARVLELRDRWTRRDRRNPFFTLGAAAYLDGPAAYAAGWARDNALLEAEFGDLHARVATALADLLGDPVRLRRDAALPGFHVHGGCRLFEEHAGSIHTDRQYLRLAWDPAREPDLSAPLSFTLPLRIPEGGAGLRLWDLHLEEVEDLPIPRLRELLDRRDRADVTYEVGRLEVHSGHQVHQIAPLPRGERDAWRITLQGHGVRCRDGWWLYW